MGALHSGMTTRTWLLALRLVMVLCGRSTARSLRSTSSQHAGARRSHANSKCPSQLPQPGRRLPGICSYVVCMRCARLHGFRSSNLYSVGEKPWRSHPN